jgi:hypothetical protein
MFDFVNLMHHLPPNSNKLSAYEPLAREIGDEVAVMKDVGAVAAKQSKQRCETVNYFEEETPLQRFYGQIGIPAVAAAVRYQGDSKNPAHPPAKINSGGHDEP